MATRNSTRLILAALCLAASLRCSGSGGGGAGADGSAGDASTGVDLMNGASAPAPTGTPIQVSYTSKIGKTETLTAMPGEVLIWTVPKAFTAVKSGVAQQGAAVLGQLPAFGALLAKVGAGNESAFIDAMRATPGVTDAFPNFMISALACSTSVPNGVTTIQADEPTPIDFPTTAAQLDFFDYGFQDPSGQCVSHGEAVDCFLDGRFSGDVPIGVTKVHIAGSYIPDMPPSYTFVFDVARLIQGAKNRPGPAVINVSLGPAQETPEAYALFFYELYEMLAVLSPETRKRISVVVSAGNAGIPLGPAIAAARAVAAEIDPNAYRNVLIAGAIGKNGDPTYNTSSNPDDMLCAPAENQDCALSPDRHTGPVSGTSIAAPQFTGLLARLAANPKFAPLGGDGLIQAVENASLCAVDPCPCKWIPTLEQAEAAAGALLDKDGGSGGTGGSGGVPVGGGGYTGGFGGVPVGGGGFTGGFGGVGAVGGNGGSGGSGNDCCACTFDVYCTAFGPGGCWYCNNSTYVSGVCQAPSGYLTSPGVCKCDPTVYQVCI